MAEFPALNLWTDAYLSDTRSLTTLEHGAYLLLLMEAWRRPNCDLPDDDRILARLAGLSQDEWAEIKPLVMGFWTFDGRGKTWKQKRLTKERDAAKKRSKSQADKAAKRWNSTKKDDAGAKPQQCPIGASTTTTIEDVEEPKGSPTPPRSARSRGTRIPSDWTPAPLPQTVADLVAEWPQGREQRELEAFVDYWVSRTRDAAKSDWDRTWHNRIRDIHDRVMRDSRNDQRPQRSRFNSQSAREGIFSVAHSVIADLDPTYFDPPSDEGGSGQWAPSAPSWEDRRDPDQLPRARETGWHGRR